MSKERNQNPTPGDTLNLRLITYNSNNLRSVASVDKVEIYFLDPNQCSSTNLDGRTLVQTIDAADVTLEDTGKYLVALATPSPTYVIGKYLDVWHVVFEENDQVAQVENSFELYPDLWYTSTIPAVYGFDFQFQPNRIRQGSIKWLIIKITPNVPRATELERYYTNLAISSNLTINIEKTCSPCPPTEPEMIVEDGIVDVRDKLFGYYQIDTTDDGPGFDCGIYAIWFTLSYAGSVEVSPKMQLQIF